MANITITTTATQDARLGPAIGRLLGLTNAQGQPRSATVQEAKAHLVSYLRGVVHTYETQRALELANLETFDPT